MLQLIAAVHAPSVTGSTPTYEEGKRPRGKATLWPPPGPEGGY